MLLPLTKYLLLAFEMKIIAVYVGPGDACSNQHAEQL